MQCVPILHIICISLFAVDQGILASSISSWHQHQHQSCTRDISTSGGISSRLYRGSSFSINSRRRSAFVQPSSCFATHHHQSITSRRTTSIITATLFPIWKQRRSNTIESILNRVGRVEVKSAIPYVDTLSTAEADMTADNLLQSATTAVDGLSKLNEGKDDISVDASVDDNTANTDESVSPDEKQEDDGVEEAKEEKSILIHTYNSNLLATKDDTTTNTATTATSISNNNNQNLTLKGVGMSQRQFAAWVQYYITHMSEDGEVVIPTTDQSSSKSSSATAAAQGILSRQPQLQETIDNNAQNTILQQQHLQRTINSQTLDNLLQTNQITTESVQYESKVWEEEYIPTIREYWKSGKLICEHTNILNGRRSRPPLAEKSLDEEESEEKLTKEEIQSKKDEETRQYKAEQFRDTLNSYAERLSSIVEDELSDVDFYSPSEVVDNSDQDERLSFNFGQIVDLPQRTTSHQTIQPQHQKQQIIPQWQTSHGLKGWIEDQYGIDNTRQLMAEVLLNKSEKEQLQTFQTFLDWFRNNFPYFHDQCDSCGAPCKDDPEPHKSDDDIVEKDTRAEGSNNIDEQQTNELADDQQEEEDDEDDFSFLGYVYPTPSEKLGNASRTELYQCRTCSSYTRFPRYNKALWVTTTQRGRCGEYSMLLYRMLRVLGYTKVRWVVDWADHVWAEVWLGGNGDNKESNNSGGRWVHLDPCEAAVDNPLLYESWGKNQTYIVAFHDPFYTTTSSSESIEGDRITVATTTSRIPERSDDRYRFPPVEDVTRQYTSDEAHVIEERRGILDESVAEAINEVSKNMVHLLDRLRTNQL